MYGRLAGGQRLHEQLFAHRHLFALPALALALPVLLCRWGQIPRGGAVELGWNLAGGCGVSALFLKNHTLRTGYARA
jgi:hypothetical protein